MTEARSFQGTQQSRCLPQLTEDGNTSIFPKRGLFLYLKLWTMDKVNNYVWLKTGPSIFCFETVLIKI
jgi:hypothetical protein